MNTTEQKNMDKISNVEVTEASFSNMAIKPKPTFAEAFGGNHHEEVNSRTSSSTMSHRPKKSFGIDAFMLKSKNTVYFDEDGNMQKVKKMIVPMFIMPNGGISFNYSARNELSCVDGCNNFVEYQELNHVVIKLPMIQLFGEKSIKEIIAEYGLDNLTEIVEVSGTIEENGLSLSEAYSLYGDEVNQFNIKFEVKPDAKTYQLPNYDFEVKDKNGNTIRYNQYSTIDTVVEPDGLIYIRIYIKR